MSVKRSIGFGSNAVMISGEMSGQSIALNLVFGQLPPWARA